MYTCMFVCRMDVTSRNRQPLITCNQGPPPPNPLVVERFQSVVSQLFQQVMSDLIGWQQESRHPACWAAVVWCYRPYDTPTVYTHHTFALQQQQLCCWFQQHWLPVTHNCCCCCCLCQPLPLATCRGLCAWVVLLMMTWPT